MPKLREDELPTEESKQIDTGVKKSANEAMSEFVSNYLQMAQMVYDMMPVASCINDDPYLASFGPGKEFVANYRLMVERTHSELIK
mmetsp:Transcript_29094/g.38750  ORF Transcript_29094/g.38750 Transcript_29094/m.38750 type:complete len:86 (+) Transcript_29094:375-632(+)